MKRSNYLDFGGVGADIDRTRTRDFLLGAGFGESSLEQARNGALEAKRDPFTFDAVGSNYCDFCFARLMGGEYDRLDDGRERCVRCSRTVIRTKDEFIDVFTQTRKNMEAAFEITIGVPMQVHMVNAREIARRTGEKFEPTPGVSARVLGFASKSDDGYSLNIENGSPALAAISTVAHELTHIWQFSHWKPGMVETIYGEKHQLLIAEGMASWVQIQYLWCIQEVEYAERQEAYTLQREDEYGEGFRRFLARYPLNRSGSAPARTPFSADRPL